MQKVPDEIVDLKNPFDHISNGIEHERRRPQAKRERKIHEEIVPTAHAIETATKKLVHNTPKSKQAITRGEWTSSWAC